MKRFCLVLVGCACAAAIASASPQVAWASNIQVNIGPGEQAFGDCGLLDASTTGAGISAADSCRGDVGLTLTSSRASHQAVGEYTLAAPSGITINQVSGSLAFSSARNGKNDEYDAGDHWAGGGMHWTPGLTQTNTRDATTPPDVDISSSWWQFWLSCVASESGGRGGDGCDSSGSLTIKGFVVQATESTAPSLIAAGSNNIFYQGRNWIWNPAGDPWSASINGNDVTGVCQGSVAVTYSPAPGSTATATINQTSQTPAQGDGWQQCPDLALPSSVDTQSYAHDTYGSIGLRLKDTNAATISSTASTTLNIDNVPPTVSFQTPNDDDPGNWAVNHAVQVNVLANTGPSGQSSLTCTVDGAAASLNSENELTVDGNGQHVVTCSVANNAIDPQGQHNTGSASEVIDIDEQAPTVSFEEPLIGEPAYVAIEAADDESPVTSATIAIAPRGSSDWRAIPTSLKTWPALEGPQFAATVPDAGLKGPYEIRGTACSQVGNCSSVTESVVMPLRGGSLSEVSFERLGLPARTVVRRVRIGAHYRREGTGRHRHRVLAGGHVVRVPVHVRANQACGTSRVRVSHRRWVKVAACRSTALRLDRARTVRFGQSVILHGIVISLQSDIPAHVPVVIATAPVNGLQQFVRVGRVLTNDAGEWSFRLPPGPSRIIHATYGGQSDSLPAVGTATVSVPARIELTATPRSLPWSGVLTFSGRLLGGYVPPDGVALRLLVRYPGAAKLTPLVALRTDRRGRFSIQWSYNAGQGVATYPFYIGTTAAESDYPFAPSQSRGVAVTFRP